jgi:hypothetical protein
VLPTMQCRPITRFAGVSGKEGLVLAPVTTGPGPAASGGTPGGPGPWLPCARADAPQRTDEVARTPPSGYGQTSFQHPDGMIHGDPYRGNLLRDGHHAVPTPSEAGTLEPTARTHQATVSHLRTCR